MVPIDVKLKDNPSDTVLSDNNNESHDSKSSKIQVNSPVNLPKHLKGLDLGDLTDGQRKLVSKVLVEQADAFAAKDDDDVGSIPNLQMNIQLNNAKPVQKDYVAVPHPLYPEVEACIEDFLNRNFIRMSNSPYSSPVVCVRKKDQTLRLCVDYRELNRKTQIDRHPIPRIQETLDNLGGNSWFSVVDQGKLITKDF